MIVEQAKGIYTDYRIPGMVATESGTLLRYCECRKARSDWADIDIQIARSTDAGENWQMTLLIESGGNTLNNPVMFVDGDRLVFLYCRNYKEIWKCVSTDDGRSFGAPQRIDFEHSVDFFYNVVAVGPGHGIVHNGRLIVPAWFAYNRENAKAHDPSLITTLYSDDHGETWQIGEVLFSDRLVNPSECALAVTAEDEILISIRHENGIRRRAFAVSADGISAWREFRFHADIADPICMGSMTHRNGTVYHINCDSEKERRHLTIRISGDGFRTFRSIPVSEMAGYSDIALLNDRICVLYEKTTDGPFRLYFETIGLPPENA